MKYQKKQLVNGVIWSGIDKLGVIVVQLLLEIILARHLLPKDYGVIGMATIFIALGILFSESGFSSALIQKQDRTEIDFSTAFYFNLLISLIFVSIIFLIAPYAADFFNTPILTNVLRILSVGIIFNAIVMVHKTKLSISLDFKTQAKVSFISLIISGSLGIYLAINGYGVWSLVTQILAQNILTAILLLGIVKWFPLREFSKESFSRMFKFGSKILAAGLVQSLYTNIYYLFIGKKMSASTLGLYTKANQFTFMPASLISGILQRVMFPFFSESQHDSRKLFYLNQEFTKLICIVIFPIFVYLALFAEPLVYFGLSVRWMDSVNIVQILAIAVLFFPLTVNNMTLFQVKNLPSQFLYLEIFSKVIGVIIFLVAVQYGIIALCFGLLLQQFIHFVTSSICVQLLLKEKLFAQIFVILPCLIYAVIIAGIISFIKYQFPADYLLFLLLGSLVFCAYYAFIYLVFLRERLRSLFKLFKKSAT